MDLNPVQVMLLAALIVFTIVSLVWYFGIRPGYLKQCDADAAKAARKTGSSPRLV